MTESELRARLVAAIEKATNYIKDHAPYDTGNLSRNAIKYEQVGYKKWKITVNQDIAPYMPYTNEKWLSPKWHGKQNPNEGWWNDIVIEAMNIIATNVGGVIKND